jgi:GrpB-like predicted nucleotidyltransferase (UPF0157 family)
LTHLVEQPDTTQAMIEIISYQARWPAEFEAIAGNLRRGLGDLALRIDHIGSTAVPGLAAKDVIDIQITAAQLNDRIVTALSGMGYRQVQTIQHDHHPPGTADSNVEWSKLFFLQPPDQRRTNVHVRVAGRANQRYALLFRDYLRVHPASADAYAELKERLSRHLADPQTYPDVKDPAVDLIYLAAEEWAAFTDWCAGPADG